MMSLSRDIWRMRVVLAFVATAPRYAIGIPLDWPAIVEEGWSAPSIAQSTQTPVDVNSASLDALLEVPELEYAQAQLILSQRPFTTSTWETFINAQGLSPLALGFLTLVASQGVYANEWELRTGILFSDRKEVSTARAGSYTFTRARARIVLPGTHAAAIGFSASRRPRTSATYDIASGKLTSAGPMPQTSLDDAYLYAHYPRWSAVLGGFAVGFGEGLVFSQGAPRHTDGWLIQDALHEDIRGARIRLSNNLQGVAAQSRLSDDVEGVMFVSSRLHDLYQYDLRYGPDAWDAERLGGCDRVGAVKGIFTCDGRAWYTNDIGVPSLQYQYIRDAFREDLGGVHLRFRNAGWRMGVTGYRAAVSFPRAWPSARLAPAAQSLGGGDAAGADLLWEGGAWRVSGEIARAGGDSGVVLHALWSRDSNLTLDASARYYGADFRNAHSRADAASDQTEGYARRNEAGGRLRALWRIAHWNLGVEGDGWFAPYRRDTEGAWQVAPPDVRSRVGIRVDWRYAVYRIYSNAYVQRRPPSPQWGDEANAQNTSSWAYRSGAWGRWSNRWRAGLEYRVLARGEGEARNNHHIAGRLGYKEHEAWLDIASAPSSGDPRAQVRYSSRIAWTERHRLDLQYGVFLGEQPGRWRNVIALAWESDL